MSFAAATPFAEMCGRDSLNFFEGTRKVVLGIVAQLEADLFDGKVGIEQKSPGALMQHVQPKARRSDTVFPSEKPTKPTFTEPQGSYVFPDRLLVLKILLNEALGPFQRKIDLSRRRHACIQ